MSTKDILMPECNFHNGRSLQSSWPDDRLLSSGANYCSNAIDSCGGRSINNSFLPYQSPTSYHLSQEISPLQHRQEGEEINSNHLLMSPTTLTFNDDEHRIFRMDKIGPIDRGSKDCGMSNSSIPTVPLHSVTSATNPHNQAFSENYYEAGPTMGMIDPINPSNCYSTHHNHQHHTPQHNTTYDNLGERNTVQHNMFDAATTENYNYIIGGATSNSMQPLHCSTTATSSEVSSSLAEDSLSSSTVAVYHFNNSLIDFTNPSDIFQFDRVYSSSNDVDAVAESSMYSHQQNHQHQQHQSMSPSSNQGIDNKTF